MPRRVIKVRQVTEAMIENRSVQEHEARGWKCWKQSGLGRAGRPDRHYMGPGGISCHIEFKRPGEFPTKLQQQELDELELMGHFVAACDSVDSAKEFTESVEKRTPWAYHSWRHRWVLEHKKRRR
jgi:hypothetical protein